MHTISQNNTHFTNQITNQNQVSYDKKSKNYGKKNSFAFTDLGIKHLKPSNKRTDYWHSGLKGFGIRVAPSGRKTWFYLYSQNRIQRRMSLGYYPKVSLAQAVAVYHKFKERVLLGFDPLEERNQHKKAVFGTPTILELIQSYIEYGRKTNKASVEEERKSLERYIIPKLGKKKIIDVEPKELSKVFHHIVVNREAPVTAQRLYSYTRRLFNYAADMGLMRRRDNPCLDIKLNIKKNKRDRHLSPTEIYKFWHRLDKILMADITRLALKFMLVTLARGCEVRHMRWSDIDFSERIWTLPKTKNGHTHRIYLGDIALQILDKVKKHPKDSEYVFGSAGSYHSSKKSQKILKPMSGRTLCQPLNRHSSDFDIKKRFTPHDLRRTGATIIAGLFGRRDLVKMCLNHVSSDVTSIYDQYTYDIEKKKAMNALNIAVQSIINSKDVKSVPNFSDLRKLISDQNANNIISPTEKENNSLGFQANLKVPVSYTLSYGHI
ncbi:MAG: tyrosine-type recombinase/integrase [Flavobacteriaceae bacterium]|nr:tyrosine-type recombinase/integrase [Flavobacteriaceae bacterium]